MDTTQHDFESELARTSLPYPEEAYDFVREGLGYTECRLEEAGHHLPNQPRHMKGQELCLGLRDFAIERWGIMAPAVLRHWQIHRTEDFGRIVFVLVNEGTLSKTDDDSLADFRGVYDLLEAFGEDRFQDDRQVRFQDG